MVADNAMLADLAYHLNLVCPFDQARKLPPTIFLTDDRRAPNPSMVLPALPRGSAVILRNYCDKNRATRAFSLRKICRHYGLLFLISGDPALALKTGADGVHLPEWYLRRGVLYPRRLNWLVTVAAHSKVSLTLAARVGADAALLSPVFPTDSHKGESTLGVVRFSALVRSSPVPVYALGGVDSLTVRRLAASGAVGVAAIKGLY